MELGSISNSIVHSGAITANGDEKHAMVKPGGSGTASGWLESHMPPNVRDVDATSRLLAGSPGLERNNSTTTSTRNDDAMNGSKNDESSVKTEGGFDFLEFLKNGLSSLMNLFKDLFSSITNGLTSLTSIGSSLANVLSQLTTTASAMGNPLSLIGKFTGLFK